MAFSDRGTLIAIIFHKLVTIFIQSTKKGERQLFVYGFIFHHCCSVESRDVHNNIVIVLVVLASTNIFIAISVTCNILYCNIYGHQYIYCNICVQQYIVLQYVQPINILIATCDKQYIVLQYLRPTTYCIAISPPANMLYCNISIQQYIDQQHIVLQYLQSTMLFCSIYRQVTKNTLKCNIRCINTFADISDTRSCNLQIQSHQTMIRNFLLKGTIVGRELVLDIASRQDTTG
jgi:hypothetical protein